MADKIKGITVEIGADPKPLRQALSSINKDIKTTQTQLKEVEKLLKLDPKNTDLLKEKQKLLADQIEKTKKKLEGLKQAQEEAKKMLANGEIGEKEYQALENQIAQCEKELVKFEKQSAETQKALKLDAEKIGKAFQEVGGKIEDAGKKLAPFSAAAAAGLGAAVKTTADFDTAMSEVAAISGATGDAFDALRNKAREAGSTTKYSASEAAEGMKYMAMAGWQTEDMLDGLDGILGLAAASGEDLGTTSDIVTDALTALGYSAGEAGHLSDVLAAASSNANTNVSLMGETFKNAASVAGAYGYTMEDIALATGLMANSGIKGSEAGTALRSIMSRLATDAGASSKKLGALGTLTEKLGVAFYNTDGTMRPFRNVIEDVRKKWNKLTKEEQANYAKTIAGQKAMNGWLALMNSADDDFDKLADAIDNSTGTAQHMADVMQDNLEGQLTILKSQLQELAISLGDVMMPTIRKIVGAVQEVVDWLNSLDESTKEAIVTVGMIVAAASPVLIILGKTISAIGTIITSVGKLGGLLSGIGGPITLAVAGIAALTGAIISYRNSLDEAREEHAKLSDSQQELKNKVLEEADAWDKLNKSREEAYAEVKEQSEQEKELWQQLQKVVDEQGNVIEGKEGEAKILIDSLNAALGTELELVGNQVKGYQDLKDSIDEVIAKKQAEALLTADTENYTKALLHHDEVARQVAAAEADVLDQEQLVADQEAKIAKLERELEQARSDANDETGAMAATVNKLTKELETEKSALDGDKQKLEELKSTHETARKTLDGYDATLSNHDKLQKAIASGSTEDLAKAQRDLVNNFLDAETGTKESLQRQTRAFLDEYTKQREIVQKTGSQEAKEASYNTHALVQDSINELKKLNPQMAAEFQKELNTINAQNQKWNSAGTKNAKALNNGVSSELSKTPALLKSKLDLSSQASVWGKDMMQAYASSIKKYSNLPSQAAGGVAKNINKVLGFSEPEEGPLSDFHTYGPDMMALLAKGITDNSWQVLQAVQGVASTLKSSLEGTTLTAQLDQKSIPIGTGVTLNIANFNNYSDSDIRELTNEIMETAANFAARKGAVFA